jgi:hypothetical protein
MTKSHGKHFDLAVSSRLLFFYDYQSCCSEADLSSSNLEALSELLSKNNKHE